MDKYDEQIEYPNAPVKDSKVILMQELAREALLIQSACNLSGVVKSFDKVMEIFCNMGMDTELRNTHPISRLYAEQILWLSGGGLSMDHKGYGKAYEEVKSMAYPVEVI